MVPVCAAHAFSIDEIMLHAEQKSWYAGKNLQAGDFFTYGICDGTQHTLFDTSSFAIHRDIPLPVSGILYDPYWPLPEPRVLFVFELVDTNL